MINRTVDAWPSAIRTLGYRLWLAHHEGSPATWDHGTGEKNLKIGKMKLPTSNVGVFTYWSYVRMSGRRIAAGALCTTGKKHTRKFLRWTWNCKVAYPYLLHPLYEWIHCERVHSERIHSWCAYPLIASSVVSPTYRPVSSVARRIPSLTWPSHTPTPECSPDSPVLYCMRLWFSDGEGLYSDGIFRNLSSLPTRCVHEQFIKTLIAERHVIVGFGMVVHGIVRTADDHLLQCAPFRPCVHQRLRSWHFVLLDQMFYKKQTHFNA